MVLNDRVKRGKKKMFTCNILIYRSINYKNNGKFFAYLKTNKYLHGKVL